MATSLQCDIVSAEAQIYSGAVELLVAAFQAQIQKKSMEINRNL